MSKPQTNVVQSGDKKYLILSVSKIRHLVKISYNSPHRKNIFVHIPYQSVLWFVYKVLIRSVIMPCLRLV